MTDRPDDTPTVLITGAAGNIGRALSLVLKQDYVVVGLDQTDEGAECDTIVADLTDPTSISSALDDFRRRYGNEIASVVHLAAYFDFTGEDHPLYRKLNVDGTRLLLEALQQFDVGQFVYSGTMLVHEPCEPGERIDETSPIAPKWAYPESKAAAEEAIKASHGDIPFVLLHLAGLYDDTSGVPTLTHQIARIFERDVKSRLYAGDTMAGQSMIHRDDLTDLFRRTVDARERLPKDITILGGEPEAVAYSALQNQIGRLIHGEREWETLTLPRSVARVGSWIETQAEPLIPDDFDKGQKPFIRPFMIDMSTDHYALDISRARELLGWRPEHDIRDSLPNIVQTLKDDPLRWYERNGITPPDWMTAAEDHGRNPSKLRSDYDRMFAKQHRGNLWTQFANMGLGVWLITSPFILGYESEAMRYSDYLSGSLVLVLSFLALDHRAAPVRWITALVGVWVMSAPLVFWAPTSAAYLTGTLVGALIAGFAILAPPVPGVDPAAELTGPTTPPGWSISPSSWGQRLPIILLAVVGLIVSRYLAAYQLGHIDGIWDPFFGSAGGDTNGTERIVTSKVSEAWPVSDAGLGGLTYMIEILTGVLGTSRRWRTMPWLVLLFGFLIVPLGAISITFIIIQPIVIGTWCTLCLVAAAAMLIQIPYSLDELAATCEFLWRCRKEGRPVLKILVFGDTDEGRTEDEPDEFARPYRLVLKDMWKGGLTIPWTLAGCIVIGISLMFTRETMGNSGGMADADHLVGSLVVTFGIISLSEIARAARFLIVPLGGTLTITPFIFGVGLFPAAYSVAAGLLLIALSLPRGKIPNKYGSCARYIF